MAYASIASIAPQFENYPNYWLKAYEQGTTTPKVMATDSTGATTASKFEINTNGFIVTAGAALVIPYIDGAYDLWLFSTAALADANTTGGAIQLADNVDPSLWADPANINYLATGAGAVTRTVESKFNELVSVGDFGAVGDGATDDTVAIQAALDSAKSIYFDSSKSYRVTSTLSVSTSNQIIDGNGAGIVGDYEQSVSPAYTESLIYVLSSDNVTIKDIKLTYTGTYTVGGIDYGGYLSGIQIEESDNFKAINVEASGWNRAGISIATDSLTSVYCDNPLVTQCNLYSNRVSGVLFGNTSNGIVSNNRLNANGLVSSAGTGYGFAGWSEKTPKDTLVSGNQCHDNFRKGIDFHSGIKGVISNNSCNRNIIYGIFVSDVSGAWIIEGNSIAEMTWGDEFPTSSCYGIRVGSAAGQGVSEIPTTFVVDGNIISEFTKTAGTMFPLATDGAGLSYGKVVYSNNIIIAGVVSQIHWSNNSATGTEGNFHDISFISNEMRVTTCDSTLAPIAIRSSKNRQKALIGNQIEITNVTATGGLYTYDTTVITAEALVAVNNSFTIPTSAWSAVYDPISVKRLVSETSTNNIVRGAKWRDWDGYRFTDSAAVIPATNYWTVGSLVTKTDVAAGGSWGWVCTTAGTAGTWKTLATVQA